MAPVTQSYDPKLVGWIVQASKATGADPAALLATTIQESGARLNGSAGDNGTSFGPFQFHVGGALGSHSPAWASTYDAVLNRAQEFKRLGVHGGVGAAAVQRPADRSLYAQGVGSHLQQAKAILAHFGLAMTTPPKAPGKAKATPALHAIDPSADIGPLIHSALEAVHPNSVLAKLPGSSATPSGSLIQDLLNENAAMAHVSAPTLPTSALAASPEASAAPTVPSPPSKVKSTPPLQPTGKVVGGTPKIIGTPYHGTHTLGNWESDNAVDIALPVGTPIRAPSSGIIGSQIGSLGAAAGSRFAGLRVHLKTGGNELYFAHLSRLTVKAGQRVQAGQVIGYSGSANGVAHLHLGAMNGNPGRYA